MNKKEWFVITRLHRDDVKAQGFDGDAMSDKDMEKLAVALHDTLMENNQWTDTIDSFCETAQVKEIEPIPLY